MQQSPFENIFNIIGGLSEGNEKPMKHGFYNAFALFVLTICCAAVYVLFLILEPFFKPLFWALLVGSILHPSKYKIAQKLKTWFEDHDKNNSSVVLGLTLIPFKIINRTSDAVGQQFRDHYKVALTLLCGIFVIPWLYSSVPENLVYFFWQIINFIGITTTVLINFCNSFITLTVACAYFISVTVLWTPERAPTFCRSALLLWIVITGFLAGLTGSLQVYAFVFLQLMGIAGFVIEVLDAHKKLQILDPQVSIFLALQKVLLNNESQNSKDHHIVEEKILSNLQNNPPLETTNFETPKESPSPDDDSPDSIPKRHYSATESNVSRHAKMLYKTRTMSALPLSKLKSPFENKLIAMRQRSLDENYIRNNFYDDDETTFYFKLLFYGCACMLTWKYIWLLPVLLFFLAIHVLKQVLDFFGVWLFCENQYNNMRSQFKIWWKDRQSAILPAHVKGVTKILSQVNISARKTAYDSVDTVSTCIVIVGLLLFLLLATVFVIIQIYSEAIVVVQLCGSLLNSTFVQNSELGSYLPEGWEDKLDGLIDDAYTYGREGISSTVKSLLKDGEADKVTRVEQQLLELWDRVYQSWVSGHFQSMGPQVDSTAVHDSWDSFMENITQTPGLFDVGGMVSWIRANVGTLTAIASSMWAPLASNMSLLAGSLGATTWLLLSGGTAILNFLINTVVFFTTLFYLLASSNALYKPVEVITRIQPNFGPKLGIALSVAINQVFRASFKMALFYGLWTWLVHNLFGAKVVYLPSVLAAVLGAAPFLGPYLAGLPAAIDVWLQGRPMAALLLPIVQAAPIAFLDAAVYAEIKDGGHPYVTGLAIAGGIFYLGPEGAILGPLLLCCLMVVFNLSSSFLRDTPAEERAALHSRVRLGAYM